MKAEQKKSLKIVVLLAGACLCLVLLISILVFTQQSWLPLLAQQFDNVTGGQDPYPTYTELPTYTFFPTYTELARFVISDTPQVTATPGFRTELLPNYEMTVVIPSDWNVWETNPRKYDGYGDTCYDYLIDSPDYRHEVKISVVCGGHGAAPSPCPSDFEIVAPIREKTLIRFPDKELPRKYIYASATFSPGCTAPSPESIWMKFHGELHDFYVSYQYVGDGSPDFALADGIVLSFLGNP